MRNTIITTMWHHLVRNGLLINRIGVDGEAATGGTEEVGGMEGVDGTADGEEEEKDTEGEATKTATAVEVIVGDIMERERAIDRRIEESIGDST